MDLYFHGVWRMDWGFGNPNKTATLIVMLLFATWAAGFISRRGFWASLILTSILGVLLVHTFSRGGMLAFGIGGVALLWFADRPWAKTRILGGVLCVWAILGASVYLQANQRFAQGIEDRSIGNRLEIWKEVPEMISDSLGGWGVGNAVPGYQNWYQALDHGECYLNLVSTHITWLVEFSWWERILYCFGWLGVGLLCWPVRGQEQFRWFAVPLAIWISFFVTGIFSHVAELIWLWVLPVFALLAVLVVRFKLRAWPCVLAWSEILAVSMVFVGAVTIWGMTAPGFHVHGSRHLVGVGDGEPRLWIVMNTETLGDHYGKALRRYMEGHPLPGPLGIVDSVQNLPAGHHGLVVVAGELQESDRKSLHSEERLLLLNPTFFPQEVGITSGQLAGVDFGEFSQSPSIQAWQSVSQVKTLEGVGDFIPSWPDVVFNSDGYQ